jgi:hypothetical protein
MLYFSDDIIFYFEQQKSFKKHVEKFKIPLYFRSDIPEIMAYESSINQSVTRNIADQIVDEMNLSFEDLNFAFEKVNDNTYSISCDGHQSTITSIDDCKCFRFTNKRLPCFHIFALRNHLNIPLFDRFLIPTQYDKDVYFQTSELPPISRVSESNPVITNS